MANKVWVAHSATIMLLLITWKDIVHCSGLTVRPPQNLSVTDLGYLGYLQITWSPVDISTSTKCSVQYQLEYFNTHSDDWLAIRTQKTTYNANFDLMKDVRVRVYTLLDGSCTNNKMTKSTNFTEVIQKPSNKGVTGTRIQNFLCVFYNMQYTKCTWKRGLKTPANAEQTLYFWHRGLLQAVECPKYIESKGVRSGCNFTEKSLPTFKYINFCVNGSSYEGALKQRFIHLQIQNHIKPAPVGKINLTTGWDGQLKLSWEPPAGIVSHCLKWEVEHTKEESDGKISTILTRTRQTSSSLSPGDPEEKHCFSVRSKVNKYCSSKSFWSAWSPQICHPEEDADTVGDLGGSDEGPPPVEAP